MHSTTFEYLSLTHEQVEKMSNVRTAFAECAAKILINVPSGPHRTYLIRKLRECGMWANVAITRDADGGPRE